MNKAIIFLLIFAFSDIATDWCFDHGLCRVEDTAGSGMAGGVDAAHRKDAGAEEKRPLFSTPASKEIADLWHISAEDLDSRVNIFGEKE